MAPTHSKIGAKLLSRYPEVPKAELFQDGIWEFHVQHLQGFPAGEGQGVSGPGFPSGLGPPCAPTPISVVPKAGG